MPLEPSVRHRTGRARPHWAR